MTPFYFLFALRALSGVQNGLGYAGRKVWRSIVSYCLMASMVACFLYFYGFREAILHDLGAWAWWAAFFCLVIGLVGFFGVEDNFAVRINLLPQDIHFWETLATGGATLAWIFADENLFSIVFSVYPALILHKGFVNIGAGLRFFDRATDDPTGDTFSIPLLGIKIRRLSTQERIGLALFSIAAVVLSAVLGFELYLSDLFNIIKGI